MAEEQKGFQAFSKLKFPSVPSLLRAFSFLVRNELQIFKNVFGGDGFSLICKYVELHYFSNVLHPCCGITRVYCFNIMQD